jgi:crotonobetainyl-CoA:carnitine CoA-transferase CaiB-like acyl-CoA transferase
MLADLGADVIKVEEPGGGRRVRDERSAAGQWELISSRRTPLANAKSTRIGISEASSSTLVSPMARMLLFDSLERLT